MTKPLGFSIIALLVATAACGPDNEYDGTSRDTAEQSDPGAREGLAPAEAEAQQETFVSKAAQCNLLEIRVNELALQRSQRADVKALAEMLIADYSKAGEDLKAAAASATITPLATLDDEHQAKFEDVSNASAENFDKDYLDFQEEAHEQTIALFERYVQNGPSGELKNFASTTLPALKGHLTWVREIREGLDLGDDFLGVGSGDDETEDLSDQTKQDDTPSN